MTKILIICLFVFCQASLASASSLNLLTWNIFMFPKPINMSLQKTRAKLIADTLKDSKYDVLLFQEAFAYSATKVLKRDLKANYPYQTKLKTNGMKLNSGLMIFSRFPFNILAKTYFDDCVNTDCYAAKGVLLIEVILPDNKKIQIANTHMQAWNNDESKAVRMLQFKQIKSLLDEHAIEGVPQLLAGDLNVDGKLPDEYGQVLAFLEMESIPLSGELGATNGFKVPCYKTPAADPNGEWLDHVFLKKHNSLASVEDKRVVSFKGQIKNELCPLSDHYALESKITF